MFLSDQGLMLPSGSFNAAYYLSIFRAPLSVKLGGPSKSHSPLSTLALALPSKPDLYIHRASKQEDFAKIYKSHFLQAPSRGWGIAYHGEY